MSKIGKISINILVKTLNEHQKITAKEEKTFLPLKNGTWSEEVQARGGFHYCFTTQFD